MEYSSVNTIWVLLGAALVFFMQAGFSMCEAGFTRAKNTGNILMKNLMEATGSEDFTAAIPEGLPEEIRALYELSHG